MSSKIALPDANAPLVDLKTQRPTVPWFQALSALWKRFTTIEAALTDAEGNIIDLENASNVDAVQSWELHGIIEYPENKTYVVALSMAQQVTITSTVTDCDSGTCNASFRIDGVQVTGGAHTVSTAEETQNHSSNNVAHVGDSLQIIVSSVSTCEGFAWSIKGTRTLTES